MTGLRRAIGRAMDSLRPWPSRRERKAAIACAREQRDQAEEQRRSAEAAAARAARLRRQIEELDARNGFAAAIAEQIIARHGGNTG